jgi:DNA processing protein
VASDGGQARDRLALLLAGGGRRCRRWVAEAGTEGSLFDLLRDRGVPAAFVRSARGLVAVEVPAVIERVERDGWRWIVPADEDFPTLLTATADPPLGLFVCGRLGGGRRVAVVGSRRATAYGRQVARLLADALGRAGVVVVSGMARGVDAAAHEGAVACGGQTWAVWGTGPDRVYPPEHGRLADEIASHGALVTEYPPGTPPRKHHFPERNRLLAGVADAVVVVEAAARSGALVTARLAVDEGREVFAVPGSIFSDLSIGPNTLLRLGARPLLNPNDVLHALDIPGRTVVRKTAAKGNELQRLLEAGETVTSDELAARAGRPVADILQQVLQWELEGLVQRHADGRYSLARGIDFKYR